MVQTGLDASLRVLEQSFAGRLIRPDGGDYDEARTLFNAMVDKRPG
jgi:hypothetical protein